MGGIENIWQSNIYYHITTLSLFHFLRNSQHPQNGSVYFKNLQFQFWKGIFRNSL